MDKKLMFGVIILLVIFISAVPAVAKKDRLIGLSAFGGGQIKRHHFVNSFWYTTRNHQWKYLMIHPIYGLVASNNGRWELYLEGNIGYLSFHSKNGYRRYKTDTLALGASILASYDFLRFKNMRLFAECGVGLGYWAKSPDKKLVKPDILGLINYGVGLKVPLGNNFIFRSSFRFTHNSSIPSHDTGANTAGVIIGIAKYFN